jgi:hypothetical protein
MNSASLCSLAGRYENPIPPQCLAPIDFLKIPALAGRYDSLFLSRFPWPIDCFEIPAQHVFYTRDRQPMIYFLFCLLPLLNISHTTVIKQRIGSSYDDFPRATMDPTARTVTTKAETIETTGTPASAGRHQQQVCQRQI